MYNPRTVDDIYESMKGRLTGRIEKLTNFVDGSFNKLWTTMFAEQFREKEEAILASQLSGMIDYAGGPITDADLNALEIDNVDPDDLNQYLSDEDLSELVKLVGINRRMGEEATGRVEITTFNSNDTIPAGTPVGTQPDGRGNYYRYTTDEDVSPQDGSTTVTASITAVDIGDNYNAGTGRVTYMPDPPSGMDSVTNPEPITGGADPETNESLRQRAKNSIIQQSGGGTVRGIENYVVARTDAIEANIDEFPDASPPYADVIVDGGKRDEVEQAIFESHPSSVRHELVRPRVFLIDVYADIEGTNPDPTLPANNVRDHIYELELGENIIEDQIRVAIMNSSSDIDNIRNFVMSVDDETHTYYSGDSTYQTEKEWIDVTEVRGTVNGNEQVLEEGTDWSEGNDNRTINFSTALDDQTEFYVDYDVDEDIAIADRQKATPNAVDIQVI